MKTASEELKVNNGIPVETEANTTISQPGPEDGRDQNIKPDSHSYEPDNGKSKMETDHNEEVHRTGEAINEYPAKPIKPYTFKRLNGTGRSEDSAFDSY